MRICVLQPDVTRIGGSISTTLQFADCFKELGHDVKVHTTFKNRLPIKLINNREEVLNFYNCNNLEYSDLVWDDGITNKQYDLCFTRGQLHGLTDNIPTILWMIVGSDTKHSDNIVQYWTNSNTTKSGLHKSIQNKLKVVYPPHDYSIFRNYIKNDKEYDVVSILRGNDFNDKGIPLYAQTVKKLNCSSMLITTAPRSSDLKKIESLGIPYVLNQTREQVAEILGKSKTFFFPSYYESCPLVIYEALNAGCNIVSRNVGAVKEQLNGLGRLFNKDKWCFNILKEELDKDVNSDPFVKRGQYFDRKNVLTLLEKQLSFINFN